MSKDISNRVKFLNNDRYLNVKVTVASELGCRNQVQRLRRWRRILQKWQEPLEVRVFRRAEQFEDDSLERGQVGACIAQGLNADIAVWQGHGRGAIDDHMDVEAASNSVECCMSHTDVRFTAVNHNVWSIHCGKDWLDARFKH